MLPTAVMQAHGGKILPVDILDPALALYLPLWYPYSDMTGSTIYSYDKNRCVCTVTGATWGRTGRTFDGVDDWIDLTPIVSTLDTYTSGTILFWLYSENDNAAQYIHFSVRNSGGPHTSHIEISINSGKLQADCLYKSAQQWTLDTDANIDDYQKWVLIGLVQDGTSPVLYVNDTAPAQAFSVSTDKTKWFQGIADRTNYAAIGGRPNNDIPYTAVTEDITGIIGDFMIYGRAFEIGNIYNATKWRYW